MLENDKYAPHALKKSLIDLIYQHVSIADDLLLSHWTSNTEKDSPSLDVE